MWFWDTDFTGWGESSPVGGLALAYVLNAIPASAAFARVGNREQTKSIGCSPKNPP
jgi:hypothetical protein